MATSYGRGDAPMRFRPSNSCSLATLSCHMYRRFFHSPTQISIGTRDLVKEGRRDKPMESELMILVLIRLRSAGFLKNRFHRRLAVLTYSNRVAGICLDLSLAPNRCRPICDTRSLCCHSSGELRLSRTCSKVIRNLCQTTKQLQCFPAQAQVASLRQG